MPMRYGGSETERLERQTDREVLCAAQPETAEPIPAEARREEPVMTLRGVGWRAGGRSILEGVDLNHIPWRAAFAPWR